MFGFLLPSDCFQEREAFLFLLCTADCRSPPVSSLFSCFLVFFFFSTFDKNNDIHQWRINYKNLRSGFYLQQQQTRRYGVLHSFLGVLFLTFVCYGCRSGGWRFIFFPLLCSHGDVVSQKEDWSNKVASRLNKYLWGLSLLFSNMFSFGVFFGRRFIFGFLCRRENQADVAVDFWRRIRSTCFSSISKRLCGFV